MTQSSSKGRNTQVSQHIKAPPETVYRAFIEADAIATWLAPEDMKGQVHIFEPREGGKMRMSLTYADGDSSRGKTSDNTDTFEGRFVELRPNEKIVQVFEFESDEPEFAGEMKMTWSLEDVDGGTEVTVLCEHIPEGISLEDNEVGSRSSLRKLAAYIEGDAKDDMQRK